MGKPTNEMKTLLIGESNPYGSDPQWALWPDPEGCSGWRLCHTVMGLSQGEYLARYDRVNLCTDRWDSDEAAISAAGIKRARVVLLGAKVCRAFGVDYSKTVMKTAVLGLQPAMLGLVLPHPSGLCRAWNEAGAVEVARRALKTFTVGKHTHCPLGCVPTEPFVHLGREICGRCYHVDGLITEVVECDCDDLQYGRDDLPGAVRADEGDVRRPA